MNEIEGREGEGLSGASEAPAMTTSARPSRMSTGHRLQSDIATGATVRVRGGGALKAEVDGDVAMSGASMSLESERSRDTLSALGQELRVMRSSASAMPPQRFQN